MAWMPGKHQISPALIALLCVVGCENETAKKPPVKVAQPASTADAGAPVAKKAADAGAIATRADAGAQNTAPADDQACKAWSARVCKEAGPTSPTCLGLKQMSRLFPPSACQAGLKDFAYTEAKLSAMRTECNALAVRLCKDLGEESETCGMVKDRVKTFPPNRCTEMMGNYAPVLEELKAQQAASTPLTDEQHAELLSGKFYEFGPKDSKVTLVEFSDFQCPFCTRAAEAVSKIKKKYGDKVRFVFRHFPLDFHKEAHLAHQAAMAAGEQGKFWEYHDKLFQNQKRLFREDLERYAQEMGLDMVKFKKALDDKTYAKIVASDLAMARKLYVTGTPTMFFNRTRVVNATDYAAISKDIDEALGIPHVPEVPPAEEGQAEEKKAPADPNKAPANP